MANSKQEQYFIKLLSAVNEVFDEDSEHYIGLEDLKEGENLTDFFHVLGNMMPNYIYNKLTGENENILSFNHIANTLIIQNNKTK